MSKYLKLKILRDALLVIIDLIEIEMGIQEQARTTGIRRWWKNSRKKARNIDPVLNSYN